MIVLGIETSCDETAAAVVTDSKKIISNIVLSQIDKHAMYNGVVPEIAAREHMATIEFVIDSAIIKHGINYNDIDCVAVTAGPGLIGGLMVGLMVAKGIASASGKPIIGVNHLEGHALVVRLTNDIDFPYLLLLASGGHCQTLIVNGVGDYEKIGETIDDSAGEAFDKVAKMLGIGYPGGPVIEKLSQVGDPHAIEFTRPLIKNSLNNNFSFSGLKTAVKNEIMNSTTMDEKYICDVCASFQEAIKDVFVLKLENIILNLKNRKLNISDLVFSGGVAANKYIRKHISDLADRYNLRFVVPPVELCTDNAAMIAWAGLERAKLNMFDSVCIEPRAKWELTNI